MKEYIYLLHAARAEMLSLGSTPAEDAILEAQIVYLQAAMMQEVVLMAVRTLNTDIASFGIVILQAASEAEANAFMQADPAVSAGVIHFELHLSLVGLFVEYWKVS